MKKLLLVLMVLTLSACGEMSDRELAEEVNVQRCINAGGFPIRSTWDGRLVDCIQLIKGDNNVSR